MNPEKRGKFVKLAEQRVTRMLKLFKLIGNLSNRNSYSYTPQDVSRIFDTIQKELDACRERFEASPRESGSVEFKLD